jgi:DNA ligase-1
VASFLDFAEVAQALSQTHSRLQIAQTVGDFLAALDPAETESCARFLIGRALAQGETAKLNVSGRAVWRTAAEIAGGEDSGEEIFASAVDFGEAIEMLMRLRRDQPAPSLTIAGVAQVFGEIAAIEGRSARKRKLDALRDLLAQATALEAKYLAKILIGEMRHGMSEGLMIEALARMAKTSAAEVRRMHMLEGDLGRVAAMLRGVQPHKPAGAAAIRPLKPMLAQPAQDVAEAFAIVRREFALEHKLDGARVQIHRVGGETRIFSRRLNEITPSLPEVVEAMERLGDRSAILDGEVIAVNDEGRPLAFQELMRRFRRVREIDRLRTEQPIRLYVFDLIGLDGRLLIDQTYQSRTEALAELAASAGLEMPKRLVTTSLAEAEQFFADAIAAGHEGVMAKALESRYTPGARGRGWLKIKHVQTLDLVIVAADWGYGRRHGWLSNYHLAAREEHSGKLHEVGKTFKGLTDDQFREMTERLLALKTGEHAGTVEVRPEVVVEVAYSDIQRSPQYESAMALRFARIVRVREDKAPGEADTIEAMAREFERQTLKPRSRTDNL